MNPSPSPTPVEVFVQSGPADWWQVLSALGPLAILAGGILAAVIGWGTLRQRTEADSRAEWWKRTQWAIDSSLSEDPDRAKVGLGLMEVLAAAAPGAEEVRIITVAWEDPLDVAAQQLAREPVAPVRTSSHRPASHDPGVQTAAAKLRLVTDRRLGQTTPEWIRELAADKPQQQAS